MGRIRQALRGWYNVVPSTSPPPILLSVLDTAAAYLFLTVNLNAALAIVSTFSATLRASKVCSLTLDYIAFPGDILPSLSHASTAGVAIWSAETGRNQFFTVNDGLLVRRLRRFTGT